MKRKPEVETGAVGKIAGMRAVLLLALVTLAAPGARACSPRAKCTGEKSCRACKDCSRCAYCKDPKKACGVCKPPTKPKPGG